MSPSELRAALSSLGKAAIQFDLSEMHDAAEVSSLKCPAVSLVVVRLCRQCACCMISLSVQDMGQPTGSATSAAPNAAAQATCKGVLKHVLV